MARIRSIKPEFWTDGKIVTLPYEARLLFIGLFNFADDHGCFNFEPDRLKMQIYPSDNIDVASTLDLLISVDLVEWYLDNNSSQEFLRIKNWEKHQKVDKPGKCRFPRESSRKLAIPFSVRQAVAKKYGCPPGEDIDVTCYYCGEPGSVRWWKKSNGQPSSWVTTTLSFDHLVAEFNGGNTDSDNMVLACHSCNKSKRDRDYVDFLVKKSREVSRVFDTEKEKDVEKEKDTLREKKEFEISSQSSAKDLAKIEKNKLNFSARDVIASYCDAFRTRYSAAPFVDPKDVGQIQRLLKHHSKERLMELVQVYVQMDDSFFIKRSHDLGTFIQNTNKVSVSRQTGVDPDKAPDPFAWLHEEEKKELSR